MTTLEDEQSQKLNPFTELSIAAQARAAGQLMPTQEMLETEAKLQKERTDEKKEKALTDVAVAIAFAPGDKDLRRLEGDLRSAQDPQTIERLAKEAKEKADEEFQKQLAEGAKLVVGIGAAMQSMGIGEPANFYAAQTCAGAPGYPQLPPNILGALNVKSQDQEVSLVSRT